MAANYQPQILWQGKSIGIFDNPRPDMWYLEGPWFGNKTAAAASFEALAKQLDLKEVYKDLDKGIEAFLHHEDWEPIRIIIIGVFDENQLFVRRMPSN